MGLVVRFGWTVAARSGDEGLLRSGIPVAARMAVLAHSWHRMEGRQPRRRGRILTMETTVIPYADGCDLQDGDCPEFGRWEDLRWRARCFVAVI